MNTQPTLPTLTDWTQPITVRGSELVETIAAARAAGFHAHRMTVTDQVVYRLQFWRLDAASEATGAGRPAGKTSEDS